MRLRMVVVLTVSLTVCSVRAEQLEFKERALADLVKQVPGILQAFDAKTGRFGSGVWICQDQEQMYPLAAAYAAPAKNNPYHKDPKLLEVIIQAGDALIQDMNAEGQWVFRKKDGSTWGNIRMPWTYSRWIRTFQAVGQDMPPEARQRWSRALQLGYGKIAHHDMGHVQNIPAHHAMGLYAAGKVFEQSLWRQQAADFLMRVVGQQTEGGYWSENAGPVVLYNFVYVDALGVYYALSGDQRVLPALEKAAQFHLAFTYPNGRNVETIDQRNPYHPEIALGNVGFTCTPIGRAYLKRQWARHNGPLPADLCASLLFYGQEGPIAEPASGQDTFVLQEGGAPRAVTVRRGPWFACLSAYTAPVVQNRWIQDRQNLVSIYHDKVGLILGGGNTKLQPSWSTFTVGDTSLLAHRPGDTDPDFLPKGTLYHTPTAAKLRLDPTPELELTYGPETCRVRIAPKDENRLEYHLQAGAASQLPIYAHLTLLPRLGQPVETAKGEKLSLGNEQLSLSADRLGGWIAHAGYRVSTPPTATLLWPVLPHNPYRADGRATLEEARLVLRIRLDPEHRECAVLLEVPDAASPRK